MLCDCLCDQAVHDSGYLFGLGFAWLVSWVSEDMLRNPDGTFNSKTASGAEG